jgi:hypothetical protein
MDDKRALLRHALATLAYRGGKTLRDCPPGFADFRAGEGTRSPVEILGHIGDLLEWALTMVRGEPTWPGHTLLAWPAEVDRFHLSLAQLDTALAAAGAPSVEVEKIFQGPIADAFTHVGQLAQLRRLAGAPVRGENYFVADIAVGRVGREQAAPRREFA